MEFRRSGQRDPRRRRVLTLTERLLAATGRGPASGASDAFCPPVHRSEHYGDALFMEEQLRLTDLIPRRLVTLFGLFTLGLLAVAGLEALYMWMTEWAAQTTDGRIAAFDLDGEGSLAVWFSSTTLLMASIMSVLVYLIRRHRTDDYQGHYRVWLWAALCWLLMSVDETASLHEGFKEMMTLVTGTRIAGDGSMWWVIAYFFLLGGVGTRLLLDMRHCWLSSGAFVMVAVCYSAAVVAQLGWILPETGARGVMVEEGAEMVGNLFLLLAMGLHARYVALDAEGLLPVRVSKSRRAHDDDDELDEEEYTRDELAAEQAILFGQNVHLHQPAPRPTGWSARRGQDAYTAGMQAAQGQIGRKLTKQEKKALRHRLEQERLNRQRRSA